MQWNNALSEKLELPKCRGLLMSHAFTGFDNVEAFYGKGKKSWLTAYQKTEKLRTS